MRTEITLKHKADITPVMPGVVIKDIIDCYDSIVIEIKFNTEFSDYIGSKVLHHKIKTIRARGECTVILYKNDFLNNGNLADFLNKGYLIREKEIIDPTLYDELPLECSDYEDMIFEMVTCFTYKFI